MGLGEDGKLYAYKLSHCSCYGPTEHNPDVYTFNEFFKSDNVLDPQFKQEIVDKVWELCRE